MSHTTGVLGKRGRENIDPNVQANQPSCQGNGQNGKSIDVLKTPPRNKLQKTVSGLFSSQVGGPAASPTKQNTPSTPTSTTTPNTPPKASAPQSPQHVHSPMAYHKFGDFVHTKRKDLKGFLGKSQHTLAPDSAEKQFRVLQRNFSEIKRRQRDLFEVQGSPVDQMTTQAGDVIAMKKDQFDVTSDGKTRTFGVHTRVLKDGQKFTRAFPIGGDGVMSFSGAKAVKLLDDYKSSPLGVGFQEFVIAQVASANANPPATSPSAQQTTTVNAPADATTTTTVQQQTPSSN